MLKEYFERKLDLYTCEFFFLDVKCFYIALSISNNNPLVALLGGQSLT